MPTIVDFHSHLMPAVDDGAASADQGVAALRALAEQGVGDVITTPHLSGALTADPPALAARLAELDAGWDRLVARAEADGVQVALHRGVELALDTPEPVLEDARLRLAGGRFVLVEFPYMTVPPRTAPVLAGFRDQDVLPVVAHPERYQNLDTQLRVAGEWRGAGAFLQVNEGSLLGRYGRQAQRHALTLLARGWVDYLSSDFHARGEPPVAACEAMLREEGAGKQAELLLRTNPRRLLGGDPPLAVPPVTLRPPLLQRLRRLLP